MDKIATAYMEEYDRASSLGEETEAARMLNDARAGIGPEEIDPAHQSFDPRAERRTKQADPAPVRPPVTAESLIETWYVYRTLGRLKTVGLMPAGDDAAGVEEQLIASLYVEDTPGFNRAILLHGQDHRGEPEPFRGWYGNWPDNRQLAAAIYDSFFEALRQRLRIQPFVVYAAAVKTPDHLEAAEAANEPDVSLRNREWRQRRAA